jgi:iron complex transport system ATP-binding protein
MSARLRSERVSVKHPGADRSALRDATVELRAGEILAIAGPNGSGKSTLLATLARALEPHAGGVALDGADVRQLSLKRFARKLARLPQSPESPRGLSVEALVESGRNPHRRWLAGATARDRAAVRAALRALELVDLRQRAVETLSGGERRRAWLGVALCQESELLLLDEPTASLDLRAQWEVLELLARLNRERGLTLAVVLHDLEQAAALAHRVAVVHRGRIYEVGPPEQVIREEMLRDVYGVNARVGKEDGFLRLRVLGPADPGRHL